MRILALCLVASAAMAQKVDIAFDQSVDFSKFTTFTISEALIKESRLNNEQIKSRINSNIQKALEAKGLTLVETGPPSLKVVYILGSETKTKVGTSLGVRANARVVAKVPYTEDTLVLGLRTATSLVWRSAARVEAGDVEKNLDDMVKK